MDNRGAYSSWVKDSIKRSDLVVWLDIPFYVLATRIILRFLKRKIAKAHRETWKDLWGLIKFARKYSKEDYYYHKDLIEKHKVNFVYIRNQKELKEFIESLR